MTELLDCNNCELSSLPNRMCSVVASRTVREMVKLGHDTMSDTLAVSETAEQLVAKNLIARDVAEAECEKRLLRNSGASQHYGTATY